MLKQLVSNVVPEGLLAVIVEVRDVFLMELMVEQKRVVAQEAVVEVEVEVGEHTLWLYLVHKELAQMMTGHLCHKIRPSEPL